MRSFLGADIFVNLLLVFLITTGLLSSNINNIKKPKNTGSKDIEMEMPKVDLPKGKTAGLNRRGSKKEVTISAKITGKKRQYFIEDKPVNLHKIKAELKRKKASVVRIRFDEQMFYGEYVRLLDKCKEVGVSDIYAVYINKE